MRARRLDVLVVAGRGPDGSNVATRLERAGQPARVDVVRDSDAVDELLSAGAHDVVVVELGRDVSALASLDRVAGAVGGRAPVVVVAEADPRFVVRCLAAGAAECIDAESDPGEFARALRMACLRHRFGPELARLARLAPDGWLVVEERGLVAFANPAAAALLGRSVGELIGVRIDEAPAPGERLELRTGLGAWVEMTAASVRWRRRPATLVCVRDVTESRQSAEYLSRLAHHDPLTGLPNRRLLRDRLAAAISRARRARAQLAVIALDLDGFKRVNDELGHPCGDALLAQVGARLAGVVRDSDTTARLGGDEFAIVVESVGSPTDAAKVARAVVRALGREFDVEGVRVSVGASVGVALYPHNGHGPEELLAHADSAMYRAKRAGRGSIRFFERGSEKHQIARLELEHSVCAALDRDELDVHFQPVFDRTGASELEALLRWRHPAHGDLPRRELIATLERNGLVPLVGRRVLARAAAQVTEWRRRWRPDVKVSVNVEARELMEDGYASSVLAILEREGLPPTALQLELREEALLHRTPRTWPALRRLADAGVSLAVDGYGATGLPIAILAEIPGLRSLKVRCPRDDGAVGRASVAGCVAVARQLGVRPVAVAVETRAGLDRVRSLGCEALQGHVLAPARSAADTDLRALDGLSALVAEGLG